MVYVGTFGFYMIYLHLVFNIYFILLYLIDCHFRKDDTGLVFAVGKERLPGVFIGGMMIC